MFLNVIVCLLSFGIIATLSLAENISKDKVVNQEAVLTRTEGEVKIMIPIGPNDKKKWPKDVRIVKVEGGNYVLRDAKKGDRSSNGAIIQTGSNGKARLIFRNGDQFTVTQGSSVKFSFDGKTGRNPVSEILFGDLRAVINKGSPRTDLKIKAKSAVMGVRGTDFYVASWSPEGGSRVIVMRGKVALATSEEGLKDAKEVTQGMSGAIKKTGNELKPVEVKATKQDFVVIEQESRVKNVVAEDPPVVVEYEQKAAKATLEDLKNTDNALYSTLATRNEIDVETIQNASVKKVFEAAPSVEGAKKPTLEDLEKGGDVYNRYRWKKK